MLRVSALLNEVDSGDRILHGNIDLFDIADRPLPEVSADELSDEFMEYLCEGLNLHYADYLLTPDLFQEEHDFASVYGHICHHLSLSIERLVRGFIRELWDVVTTLLDVRSVRVLSIVANAGFPGIAAVRCGARVVTAAFDFCFVDFVRNRLIVLCCAIAPVMAVSDTESNAELQMAMERDEDGYSIMSDDESEEESETEEMFLDSGAEEQLLKQWRPLFFPKTYLECERENLPSLVMS